MGVAANRAAAWRRACTTLPMRRRCLGFYTVAAFHLYGESLQGRSGRKGAMNSRYLWDNAAQGALQGALAPGVLERRADVTFDDEGVATDGKLERCRFTHGAE